MQLLETAICVHAVPCQDLSVLKKVIYLLSESGRQSEELLKLKYHVGFILGNQHTSMSCPFGTYCEMFFSPINVVLIYIYIYLCIYIYE